MQNFQGIILIPTETYRKIFKFALVYLYEHKKGFIYTCSNLLSQRIPHTKTFFLLSYVKVTHNFYYLIIWTFIYLYKAITFTTILFTTYKHMAHHNTIPNSATYMHLTHTHCDYTILLPPPNNSTQWIMVILTTWWNSTTSYEHQHSPNNSTTYQCATCHAGYLIISAHLFNGRLFWSNNKFLNNLCHYMVFSISEFPANIYTFIIHASTGL